MRYSAVAFASALLFHRIDVTSKRFAVPTVELQNAAVPGTFFPLTGLGLHGVGYQIPANVSAGPACWHFPTCCTREYCPAINATRAWLQTALPARLDTGYPYGDGSPFWGPVEGTTCGGWHEGNSNEPAPGLSIEGRRLGHWCDPHGTRIAIEQSAVPRHEMFITIKSGFAGPMMEIDEGYFPHPFDHGQAEYMLNWLGLEYADLYLMHEGDLGSRGQWPARFCAYPTTKACRLRVWKSCLEWMERNKTRACGVANWELAWLKELLAANVTLPAVVQTKFHVHQSLASPRIKAIKNFCDANGILFNGYSPLGRADWTQFEASVGTPTLLDEPAVVEIANRLRKTPAQILLRWHARLGIPTQPRTSVLAHMEENLNVFDWGADDLTEDDMRVLGSMPQCNETRGDPFMDGDPEDKQHTYVNMIGPTLHC